jgi:hypothetical protein
MLNQIEHHFILFSIIFLVIGYLLGNHFNNTRKTDTDSLPESFLKKEKRKTEQAKSKKSPIIGIDESTHVVKIKTDGLEKKYEEIGNSQTKQEDISGSINKLKNLKK